MKTNDLVRAPIHQDILYDNSINGHCGCTLKHSIHNPYRFPRVFGDKFGDEFGDEFGDSLILVTNLVTNLVIH